VIFRFDGENLAAQRAAERAAAAMVTGISEQTRAALRTLIVRAIREGIPPYDAARMIVSMIGLTEQQAGAAMSYREQLINEGLSFDRINVLVDRYSAKLLRQRSVTIARTECLPAETLVDAAVVRAVHRRPFKGRMVEVRTGDGRKFTATPNHPMLTHRGWVAAGLLDAGDHLICCRRQQKPSPPRDENVARPPTTLGEIFDAASAVGIIERRGCGKPDFHGDGVDGEVEIARPNRALMFGNFSPLDEPTLKEILSPTDLSAFPFCPTCRRLLEIDQTPCLCNGALADPALGEPFVDDASRHAQGLGNPLGRFSGEVALDDRASLDVCAVRGALAPAIKERTASIAPRAHGSRSPNRPMDGVPTTTGCLRDGGNAEARAVKLDRVTSVVVFQWAGHVFNLSTMDGYFTINDGMVTGNTMSALNRGALEAYGQAQQKGLLSGDAVKEWISTPDERACPVCLPLDGVTVPLKAMFATANGPLPGPVAHPRCRCAIAVLDPL
jgi:hypothetical protein